MAIDFSSLGATPAHTGKIDFSAIGGVPAVGQDEPTDDTTALGAAGRGAVGMLPLGEQAYSAVAGASEKKPYLQERQEFEKEIAADKENHPIARVAGQVAGVVAPALLTGGATAPESLLGAAGQGALMGGGFGAGNAIDTLASGGSGAKAAGDVALGAGLGAAGGAIGSKLAGAAESAIPGIENYAAKKAASAVGLGSDELGNMSKQELIDTGKMLMNKGIIKQGASTQEMFDAAKALQEKYGDQIGQIGDQARELGLSTDTKPLLASLEEKYKASSALQNPDEVRNANFYKKGMADILTMSRQNLPDTLSDVGGAPVPSDITFDQLQRLKKSYGNSAFMNGTVKNPAAADVYSALSSGQKAIVNTAKDNPNLPSQLKDAMTGYSKMHPVVDGLQDVLGRERAGNMPAKGFGMIGKLVGQMPGQSDPKVNALTSLGLLGAGHPLWALGAATATLQNPRAMSTLAQSTANAIPGIAEKLPGAATQILGSAATAQNMGETKPVRPREMSATSGQPSAQNQGATKPVRASAQNSTAPDFSSQTLLQPTLGADLTKEPSPTGLNINHPALAPWRQTFQKNAANATNAGEIQKSQAVTDFVLSQRDPAYAAAKQKASDEPVAESANNPANMAAGGVAVPNNKLGDPIPGFGGDLPALGAMLKNPTHEAPPARETLPTTTTQRFHQPFNLAMEEQLKAYLANKEDDDAQSR